MTRTPGSTWRRLLFSGAVWSAALSAGCTATEQGVVGGGLMGSIIGAIAGGRRHSAAGAVVGGIAGAAVGGAIGSAKDDKRAAQAAAAHQQPPLSLQDVISLTANGMSDDVIIDQIRRSGAVYHLTAQDLLMLQNSGVREPVIRELQATVNRPPRRIYTAQPVYVVEPVPPPPVGFGVGVTYTNR
jgi:hypothetical protein